MTAESTFGSLLKTSELCLARAGQSFAKLPDIEVRAGKSLAIIGSSGSGKTTAPMALAGARAPLSGEIYLEDFNIWKFNDRQRDSVRGRRIGMVFQSFHLVDALTVIDNVKLAGRCAGLGAWSPDGAVILVDLAHSA